MTEYDYSPEAVDAYVRKQQQIARWVDNTVHSPQRDPYTPATPADALHTRPLDNDPYPKDDRRRQSGGRRDRPRDRDYRSRERDRPRERDGRDRERSRDRDRERGGTTTDRKSHHPKRHRSASHAGPPTSRPDPQRSYTLPPPLPLPPFPQPNMAMYPKTNGYPPYTHAPKLTSHRDSHHSSRSSSTTRIPQVPSPTSYFPQQPAPWSAPVYGTMRQPIRSQTTPVYVAGYPQDAKYPSSANIYYKDPAGYPNVSPQKPHFDWATAPQYPHSVYQTKPPPLLKRLFMTLTGTGKPKRGPRRKRSTSF